MVMDMKTNFSGRVICLGDIPKIGNIIINMVEALILFRNGGQIQICLGIIFSYGI